MMTYSNEKIICVIPARGGSKRLARKNLQLFKGKTLIKNAINAAKKSKYIDLIVFTSEDKEMLEEATTSGVFIHYRNENLSKDNVELLYVIKDAVKGFNEYNVVVILQIDNVLSITPEKIDECIKKHLDDVYEPQDTITVDLENMTRTGSIRVISRKCLFWNIPTARINLVPDYKYHIDVHYKEDLDKANNFRRNKWKEPIT